MRAISVSNLNKTYKNGKKALNDLNLTVKSGEIFSLLGPNGAGKSTLINILTTFLQPTSGEVKILGRDLSTGHHFLRTQIACVAQKVSIDDHLTLSENMLFQGRLYKLDAAAVRKRMDALVAAFGLENYRKYRVAVYSGGVRRRLDIAMSMMSYPKILFLDEPTVGLDVESRKAMWDVVRRIQKDFGTTVFLTTHYLEEADLLSDTICIIKDGHELVQDSPDNLRKYIGQDLIRISLSGMENIFEFAEKLRSLPFVQGLRNEEKNLYINVQDSQRDFLPINRLALDLDIPYDAIEIVKPALDDVFLAITS